MKREETASAGDEKIGHAMVKGRLITDIQLKTAMDYQRSLGGSLPDVVCKLGFVRGPALAKFLAESNLAPGPAPVDTGPALMKKAYHDPGSAAKRAPKAPAPPPAPPAAAPLLDDESEAITQTPLIPVSVAPQAAVECDPALKALLDLLVQKGVLTAREAEKVLHAGERAAV